MPENSIGDYWPALHLPYGACPVPGGTGLMGREDGRCEETPTPTWHKAIQRYLSSKAAYEYCSRSRPSRCGHVSMRELSIQCRQTTYARQSSEARKPCVTLKGSTRRPPTAYVPSISGGLASKLTPGPWQWVVTRYVTPLVLIKGVVISGNIFGRKPNGEASLSSCAGVVGGRCVKGGFPRQSL